MNQLADLFNPHGGQFNLTPVIFTAALLAARVLPLIIFSPFLGGELLPTEIKIGLSGLMVVVLFPAVAGQVSHVPTSVFPFAALLCKEVFIGLCLSYIVDMVFDAARSAGGLIDTAAGANMAQLQVPQIQQQATIFSALQYQLVVTMFLLLNGHHVIITALAESFVSLPVDKFPPMSQGSWPFFDLILHVFGDLLKISLALSAPGVLAAFVTDLGLGMINRVAPQIQVFFISMAVKPMVGALMLLLTLHLTLDRMLVELRIMLANVNHALQLLL